MRKILTAIFTFALAGSLAAQTGTTQKSTTAKPATSKPATGTAAVPAKQPILAVFQTTAGDINCTLFPDKAPVTVDNFVGLATGTKDWKNPSNGATMHNRPYYDGTIFHRVIPNFMIQGGDALGTGTGDPGFTIKDEFSDLTFDQPGRLAMANTGKPHTGGAQFFITEVPTPHLNGKHTIFGQCENLDIVKQIARTPTDPRNDRPLKPVKITHLKIVNPNKPATTTPAKKPASSTAPKSSTTTPKPQ
jgi:cyclophilin family peptidyl-prolyl cis-trans isomerase